MTSPRKIKERMLLEQKERDKLDNSKWYIAYDVIYEGGHYHLLKLKYSLELGDVEVLENTDLGTDVAKVIYKFQQSVTEKTVRDIKKDK